jgi:hypothetical protein
MNVSDQEQTLEPFHALKTIAPDKVPLRCVDGWTLANVCLGSYTDDRALLTKKFPVAHDNRRSSQNYHCSKSGHTLAVRCHGPQSH